MLAGLQARLPGRAEALRALLAAKRVPVLTTYKAKGVASDHDPLVLGHYIGGVAEGAAMRAADLLLLFGFDPVEGPPQPWRYPSVPTVELTEHSFEHPLLEATVTVIGDIGASLGYLTRSIHPQWDDSEIAALKQSLGSAARVKPGPASLRSTSSTRRTRRFPPTAASRSMPARSCSPCCICGAPRSRIKR